MNNVMKISTEISDEAKSPEHSENFEETVKPIPSSLNELLELFSPNASHDRNQEEDKKFLLEVQHWIELHKNESKHFGKFVCIEDGRDLYCIRKIIAHNPNFDIRWVKNSLFMSLVRHIHPDAFHKLYTFTFGEDFDFGKNDKYK